jgi:hypothetical protein
MEITIELETHFPMRTTGKTPIRPIPPPNKAHEYPYWKAVGIHANIYGYIKKSPVKGRWGDMGFSIRQKNTRPYGIDISIFLKKKGFSTMPPSWK